MTPPSKVKDPALADAGRRRIDWAARHMPVLAGIHRDFEKERPLEGVTVGACLHVTKETAVLMRALKAGGATVALCGSNPLSTQDDVAAALADEGIHVYAWRGVTDDEYYQCVDWVLDNDVNITMDDGADLVTRLHQERDDKLQHVLAGTEETTTGVIRFRAMAEDGALRYPIVAVNDAKTKHFFDNRYGTGQSTLDGILRATSILLAGKTFVVGGYGWCGRGIALRARGMGAHVIVTEVDPVRALEALMDGFRVMPMATAAEQADIIVTATGNKHVVDQKVLHAAKDGCILANSGHFNNEIDLDALESAAKATEQVRPNVVRYDLADGRGLYVIGEGRLVNLAAAEGHPPEVMDMSFANQALASQWLLSNHEGLDDAVYTVPDDIDRAVARRKLAASGVAIDALTTEQSAYLTSWTEGT